MKWGILLMFKINNLANQTSHIVTEQKGIFSIVEHNVDFSVAPCNAMEEYYMSQMNVKRKQAIANLNGTLLEFWITPHTFGRTNLQDAVIGQPVNLEVDMLAKYVEKLFTARESAGI